MIRRKKQKKRTEKVEEKSGVTVVRVCSLALSRVAHSSHAQSEQYQSPRRRKEEEEEKRRKGTILRIVSVLREGRGFEP